MVKKIRGVFLFLIKKIFPRLYLIEAHQADVSRLYQVLNNSKISDKARVCGNTHISNSSIGDYSYISSNCGISDTSIGKFCSIGPNLLCGFGIHPIDGISTSPAFYSLGNQAGIIFGKENKIKERLPIEIGNDVFIGMNVTILDGVKIGDGAVIGAGSVVSKNIPPYAVAVGSPIEIRKYRFEPEVISKLLEVKWWNFEAEKLKDVEKHFFNISDFLEKYDKKQSL